MIFLQPRHSYAPDEGDSHIHLSAPLITAMAQLKAAGVRDEMGYRDENFDCDRSRSAKELDTDIVGVNLLGAPYIPEAIKIIERVRAGTTIVLGGQIVASLGRDFARLFCAVRDDVVVVDGSRADVVTKTFNVRKIPPKELVSSIPVWETFDEERMRAYLSHELSFYLSQGCKFRCKFCQAEKNREERYRDLDLAEGDLKWLMQKARFFSIEKLEVYLSNLDLFQKPRELSSFADRAILIQEKIPCALRLRGLSTAESFLETDDATVEKMKRAGLVSIGFGVDGATPAVWKKTGKVQNLPKKDEENAAKMIHAIERTHRFGMTPEVLMVFGHDTGDIDESIEDLRASLEFTEAMVEKYQVLPRPHVVKMLVPGALAWKMRKKNADTIELLLSHPGYFQALDYTALPSEITHPDKDFRELVEKYYRMVCAIVPAKTTRIVWPDTPEFQERARNMGTTVRKLNEGLYDR